MEDFNHQDFLLADVHHNQEIVQPSKQDMLYAAGVSIAAGIMAGGVLALALFSIF